MNMNELLSTPEFRVKPINVEVEECEADYILCSMGKKNIWLSDLNEYRPVWEWLKIIGELFNENKEKLYLSLVTGEWSVEQ